MGLLQKLTPKAYRTIDIDVFLKITALAALSLTSLFAQAARPEVSPVDPPASEKPVPALEPDMNDLGVLRAQQELDRTKQLIGQGALPMIKLRQAQEALEDAKDMSILRGSFFSKDLLPEQADQMVLIAKKMLFRRQQSLAEMRRLVESGIISRSEGEATQAEMERAQNELALVQNRALLFQQMAESLRLEKAIASIETQAEMHPDWNGKVYTKFDGNGIFTPADFRRVNGAFMARFAKPLPVSADGETATHRALGFDHRGRVDVALNPDQTEGVWLLSFLKKSNIPYFAFRSAVPHRATGAHIHIGPQSTRLTISEHRSAGL